MDHPEKLTARTAERSKPDPAGEYRIQDPEVPGLSLRVRPGGRKSFILRFRTREGRQRLLTLGDYPDISVQEARKRARRDRGIVADGGDPLEDRKRARGGTLEEVAERWLEEYAKPHRKRWKEDERRIRKHLLPRLGSRPLASITADDMRDLHLRVGRRAKVEANRVVTTARAIFNQAHRWGLLPASHPNPAKAVKPFREHSRERWLRPEEVEALGEAIRKVEDPLQRAAVQLLLLTGCRVTELLRARWDRVDLEARRLLLEDTKTGESKTVPLSGPAAEILAGLPVVEGSSWVFPSPVNPSEPRTTIRKTWETIRKDAGVPDATVHDLRRTTGSWLIQKGVPLKVVGQALGHRDDRSTAVYARIAADQPAEALELLGDALGGVLTEE